MNFKLFFPFLASCYAVAFAAAPTFLNYSLDHTRNLVIGSEVAQFTGSGVSISQGADYYQLSGTSIQLTSLGATTVNGGQAFPLLGLTNMDGEVFMISKHFAMTDDLEVGSVNGERVRDLSSMLIRRQDATQDPHAAGYIKTQFSGVSPNAGDQIVSAQLNLFVEDGNSAEAGVISLFELVDNSWDASLTFANRPFTASSPRDGGLDAAFSLDFGDKNITATEGEQVSYDLLSRSSFDGDAAFLILSGNIPDPNASGTIKQGTQRHYIYSSDASDALMQPYVAVSYITNQSPVSTVDDQLTVNEGSSSLLTSFNLITNDNLLSPDSSAKLVSVNGAAWDTLEVSQHDTFPETFGFRKMVGTYGTLYLRETGKVYYEHNGGDLNDDVIETYTYTIESDTITSSISTLTVTITAGNQAPILNLEENNFNPVQSAVAAGDIAATFTVSDPDGDLTQVYWLSETASAPSDAQGNAYYELDRNSGNVVLTSEGASLVNALGDLPAISLGAFDNAVDRKSDFETVWPYTAKGGVYYVDKANGDDANDGLTLQTAFATMDTVLTHTSGNNVQFLQPNDTVYIVGEYTAPDYNDSYVYSGDPTDPYIWRNDVTTIKIRNIHGAAGQPITFKAWDDSTIIKSDDTAGIMVDISSYIRVIGFEVEGSVKQIRIATAEALQFLYRVDTSNNGYSRSDYDHFAANDGTYDYFYRVPLGSTVEDVYANYSHSGDLDKLSNTQRPIYNAGKGILSQSSKYVDILHNHVHHISSTGIRAQKSEFVNIIGNEVSNAARKASVGTMAIVARETKDEIAVLPDQSNLYKVVIANNYVHHTYNEIYSWVPSKDYITPHLDEGKGISLEWQDDASWIANGATGRILMANNITSFNALSGVNNHGSDRVDVIYNTSFFNSLYSSVFEVVAGSNIGITHEPDSNGSVDLGTDVRYWNNLSVIDGNRDGYAFRVNAESGRVAANFVTYDGGGNLVWKLNGEAPKKDAVNVTDGAFVNDADPEFIDPVNQDFRLSPTSPARNQASALTSSWNLPDYIGSDVLSLSRQLDDIGGHEYLNISIGYDAWLNEELPSSTIDAGVNLGKNDDLDGDGVNNRQEYLFGTDMTTPDADSWKSRQLSIAQDGSNRVRVQFKSPRHRAIDISQKLEESTNLEAWNDSNEDDITSAVNPQTGLLEYELPQTLQPTERQKFYRLKSEDN